MDATTRRRRALHARLPARLLAGVLCAWVGVAALGEPLGTVVAVQSLQLLGATAAEQAAFLLPALAMVLAPALLTGVLARGAAALSVVLAGVVLAATVSLWAQGVEGPVTTPYAVEAGRAVVLLVAAVVVLRVGPGRRTTGAVGDHGSDRRDLEGVD